MNTGYNCGVDQFWASCECTKNVTRLSATPHSIQEVVTGWKEREYSTNQAAGGGGGNSVSAKLSQLYPLASWYLFVYLDTVVIKMSF